MAAAFFFSHADPSYVVLLDDNKPRLPLPNSQPGRYWIGELSMDPLQAKLGADVYFNPAPSEDEFYCAHGCDWLRFFRPMTFRSWTLRARAKYGLADAPRSSEY